MISRVVYFCKTDGIGSRLWGSGYTTDEETIAALNECWRAHPDATVAWAYKRWGDVIGDPLTRNLEE